MGPSTRREVATSPCVHQQAGCGDGDVHGKLGKAQDGNSRVEASEHAGQRVAEGGYAGEHRIHVILAMQLKVGPNLRGQSQRALGSDAQETARLMRGDLTRERLLEAWFECEYRQLSRIVDERAAQDLPDTFTQLLREDLHVLDFDHQLLELGDQLLLMI